MVRINTVVEKLSGEISIINEKAKKIQSLKTERIISPWFSKYCDQLIILDLISEEAQLYAAIQDPRYKECLLILKETLESVASLCFTRALEKATICENYRELFLFAQEKYQTIIEGVSKTLVMNLK